MGFYFDGCGQRAYRDEYDELEQRDTEHLRPSPGKSSRTHGGGRASGIPGKISLTARLVQHVDSHARPGHYMAPVEHLLECSADEFNHESVPEEPAISESSPGKVPPKNVLWRGPDELPRAERRSPQVAGNTILRKADARLAGEESSEGDVDVSFAGGEPLPQRLRVELEKRLGADFRSVRIHADSLAAQAALLTCARAFTVANHIFFGNGEYRPESNEGLELLAHELTHVVQWQQGRVADGADAMASDATEALEREADTVARGVTGRGVRRASASSQPAMATPQPTEPVPAPGPVLRWRGPGLVPHEVVDIRRRMDWFDEQLDVLERGRLISSEEAGVWRARSRHIRTEADRIRRTEPADRAQAERLREQGEWLLRTSEEVRRLIRSLRQRGRIGDNPPGGRLVADYQVRPGVIRIDQGEAALISFVLREPASSITWSILENEYSEGGGRRFFNVTNTSPGYKYAYWDGTFTGSASSPPRTGVYRVRLVVRAPSPSTEGTESGEPQPALAEERWLHIRVENPSGQSVLPRARSGLDLVSLRFDGHSVVLTDGGGNTITARARSGLTPDHPRNHSGLDCTNPAFQQSQDLGPLPEGQYEIHPNEVQHPQMENSELRFPSGSPARVWGPSRVQLHPASGTEVFGRDEFFLHLDVGNNGTAGCIGIDERDEGKLNQIISLIAQSRSNLQVIVDYSGRGR